jgi:signal transduction histidine kinase
MATLSKPTLKQAQKEAKKWVVLEWWDRFTEPSAELTDIAERQNARLATNLFIILGIIGLVFILFRAPNTVVGYSINLVSTLVVIALGFVARTRYSRIAIISMLLISSLSILVTVALSTPEKISLQPTFIATIMLVGAILLPFRQTLVLSLLSVLSMIVIMLTNGSFVGFALWNNVLFLTVMLALIIMFMSHRESIEKMRNAQYVEAAQKERETAARIAEVSLREQENNALLETSLEELARALAQQEEATAQLDVKNRDLTRANAMAKEAARLKGEFMSTMSHELRTPLNAMLGFTGIMLEGMGGEIDDEARHMIKRMQANGDRLLHLINEVLDLAKIESGRIDLATKAFKPRELAQSWQYQMQALATQKNLAFKVNIDETLPETLYGDAERLTQVGVNLLGNAFKFTEEGSVTMDIKRRETSWQLIVTDSGIGIPPHAVNYIFDEFRQVDGSSKRMYGGSGLGLAIVRNLCRMMQGTVSVQSELNKGSIFTVTLPLREDARSLDEIQSVSEVNNQ